MKLLEKLPSLPFSSKYVWFALSLLLIIFMTSLYLDRFTLGTEERINKALENAQRLEFDLETQEIKGSVRESIQAKKEKEKKEKLAKKAREKEESKREEINDSLFTSAAEEEMLFAKTNVENKKRKRTKSQFEEVNITDISRKPVIAVIITGLGLSTTSTSDALDLPASVTLGFSPYSPQLKKWMDDAINKGHEVMLNIPMETKDIKMHDPGPYALFKAASPKDNLTRLKMLLGLTNDKVGVYSDKGEIFSNSYSNIEPILKFLLLRKIWYIYGGGYQNNTLTQISDRIGYPTLVADLYIDEEIDNFSINERLREAKKTAIDKGYAVIFARPYPITIRMLQRWIPLIEAQGIEVLPISNFMGKHIIDKGMKNE